MTVNDNFTIIFSLQDVIDYLENSLNFIEDIEFYSYILSCLMNVILHNEDLRGETNTDFDELVSYIRNITGADLERTVSLCNNMLNIAIDCVTRHIAIDHPTYSKDFILSSEIMGVSAYVHFKKI